VGEPVLRLRGLSHSFAGSPPLFENLDWDFRAGEICAVVGPSGTGKSTLLNLIAGWLKPTSGSVRAEGLVDLQWVFQNPYGVARRTAIDHVVLPLLADGKKRTEAMAEAQRLLAEMKLYHLADTRFRDLSGGEAQRLMLARALAAGPDLLLIDEPTAQLDRATTATVNDVISRACTPTSVVIVATHDQDTREKCDVVLDLGDFRATP